MNNTFIPIAGIYEKTNRGLDIFLHYYPDSQKSLDKKNGKFRIRDEKTPSANLYKDNNIWYLKDHGGSKRKNVIDIVMEHENLGFHEALSYINNKFCNNSISSQHKRNHFQANFIKVKKSEKFEIVFNESLTDFELKIIGEKVSRETCILYNIKSVKYFIREGKEFQIHSTDSYPIFCFDYGDWKKNLSTVK